MILVDSSVWIDFLRARGTPADRTLTRLFRDASAVAVTEVIVMELLAGTPSSGAPALGSRLRALPMLTIGGLAGFEAAAGIYRRCREAGTTPRSLTGCLVAVAAIGAGASLLHADRDFDRIARHTSLMLEPLDP